MTLARYPGSGMLTWPVVPNVVSTDPSALYRRTTRLTLPVGMVAASSAMAVLLVEVPTMTILPSGWTATAVASLRAGPFPRGERAADRPLWPERRVEGRDSERLPPFERFDARERPTRGDRTSPAPFRPGRGGRRGDPDG